MTSHCWPRGRPHAIRNPIASAESQVVPEQPQRLRIVAASLLQHGHPTEDTAAAIVQASGCCGNWALDDIHLFMASFMGKLQKLQGKCWNMRLFFFFQGLQEPSHPKYWALTWPIETCYDPLPATNILPSTDSSHHQHSSLSCYVLSMGEWGDNHKKSGMKYKQWKKGRRLTVIIPLYIYI